MSATTARVAKNAIQRISNRSFAINLKPAEGRIGREAPNLLPILESRVPRARDLISRRERHLWGNKLEAALGTQPLNHHATLGKIMEDNSRDDEAKMQATREMIFSKELIARVDANDPLRRKSP